MSGFTIPNTPDSLNQNQAEPDSLDFQILGNQKSGVVSGMLVAPGSAAQTVTVSSGEVLINGSYYPYAGGTVALTAYTSPTFFDIIHARLSGSTVTCYAVRPSTGGTNPRFPSSGSGANEVNLDSTDVVLAAVWRVDSGIPVAQAITDKRIFVRSSTARTLTDTVSANRGSAGDTYVNTAWTPNSTTASPFSVKVGSTWYNLSYWTANSNISTTGTITANGGFVGNASSASNMPYSGLTGTIPTWNQNTTGKAATAGVADSANAVTWANVSGKPSIGNVFNDGGNYNINISGTAAAANAVTWANVSGKPSIGDVFNNGGTYNINVTGSAGSASTAGSAGSASTAGYLSAIVNVDPIGGPYIGWSSASGWWAHSGASQFGSNIYYTIATSNTSTSTRAMVVNSDGRVAFNNTFSLRDHKENISDMLGGLDLIKQLRPRTFIFKEEHTHMDSPYEVFSRREQLQYGFIVEEVQEINPDFIHHEETKDGHEPQMWKQQAMIAALVSAVQELSAKVEALEAQ